MAGTKLLPCPFCGGKAHIWNSGYFYSGKCYKCGCTLSGNGYVTEAEAIEAWNTRAAYEMEGFFYLPKPKEPIVEVTETTNTWDGTKVRTDVFYQVRKQAIVNWARELDENIIKRICEVWNTRAERTCKLVRHGSLANMPSFVCWSCSECGFGWHHSENDKQFSYCPNCGAKVVEP